MAVAADAPDAPEVLELGLATVFTSQDVINLEALGVATADVSALGVSRLEPASEPARDRGLGRRDVTDVVAFTNEHAHSRVLQDRPRHGDWHWTDALDLTLSPVTRYPRSIAA